jgi:hypothetical protein
MGNKSTKLAKESAKVALPRTNIGNPLPISSSEKEVAKNAVETLSSTSTELNSDILKEISKWQATKKPASQVLVLKSLISQFYLEVFFRLPTCAILKVFMLLE